MVKPIRPSEVVDAKESSLPDKVIISFNQLIAENWKKSSATFLQKEAIRRIQKNFGTGVISGQEICEKGYLDIEEIFRKAGWIVEFDQPGYNESFAASFKFSKKRKS